MARRNKYPGSARTRGAEIAGFQPLPQRLRVRASVHARKPATVSGVPVLPAGRRSMSLRRIACFNRVDARWDSVACIHCSFE